MTSTKIGFGFFPTDLPAALDLIGRAERAGAGTAWLVMPPLGRDTTTIAAAALARTERIAVGTSIVPAFTRHPLGLAAQALTLDELAPGRFRLGVGTGNLAITAGAFGVPVSRPASRVREYVDVVRTAITTGEAHAKGAFYSVDAVAPRAAPIEVSLAALGPRMFEIAGEVADAAMSWHVPTAYLDAVARPAVARGAASAGRPVPPIITHVPVVVGAGRAEVLAAARADLGPFAANREYRAMFAAAGVPVEDGVPTDDLVDALFVSGDETAVTDRLGELAGSRDELMVALPWPSGVRRDQEDAVLRVIGHLSRAFASA
jgi:5,10-methylenetetrahydromethanopterin reductase